jgi:plastocyanin
MQKPEVGVLLCFSLSMEGIVVPVTAGLAVGVALILLFSIFFHQLQTLGVPPWKTFTIHVGNVTLVTIPEGASLASSDKTFEPQIVKVVIGINNTVRWVNEDNTFHRIEPDDYKDPGFVAVTTPPDDDANLIPPGEYIEYTFTKAGEYRYHGQPHLRGSVIVHEK